MGMVERRHTVEEREDSPPIPSVEYRGIFLNDEDWTLQPWSWKTFEPGQKPGTIGARTYKAIFKLLLRLRGNAIWPGMHGITTPFYYIDGAKEVADSCAIAIGSSHCEPLMRNNVGEWKEDERGPYNYITNSESVKKYWSESLKEAGGYENMYTIGMRGVHDGHMDGVGTMDEKVSALQRVLDDQRELLGMYVDSAVTAIPQVFVPYKEVLEIMDHGLVVELFMDIAWDINSVSPSWVEGHLEGWLCREFGDSIGRELAPVMKEYYRLCAIRRPEFMGWTQVELADRKAYPRGRSHVIDTEFSFKEFGNEADRYLNAYRSIADKVEDLELSVPAHLRDSYFAQIKYPVIWLSRCSRRRGQGRLLRGSVISLCGNATGLCWVRVPGVLMPIRR